MAEIIGLGRGPIPIGETLFPEESDPTCNRCGLIFACRSKSRYHERINHDVRCDECGADCTVQHGGRCGVLQECICNSDNVEVTKEMLVIDNNILKRKLVIEDSSYMGTVRSLQKEAKEAYDMMDEEGKKWRKRVSELNDRLEEEKKRNTAFENEIAHLLEEKKTDKEKKNELRERVFQLEQKLAQTHGSLTMKK